MQLSKAATKAITDHIILEHQNKALTEANQWKQQTQFKKAYTGLERILVKEEAEKLQEAEEKEK